MYDCSGCRRLLGIILRALWQTSIADRFGEEPPVSHSAIFPPHLKCFVGSIILKKEWFLLVKCSVSWPTEAAWGSRSLKKKTVYACVQSLWHGALNLKPADFPLFFVCIVMGSITAKDCAFELYAKGSLGPLNSIIGESNNVPFVRRASLYPCHINLFFLFKRKLCAATLETHLIEFTLLLKEANILFYF